MEQYPHIEGASKAPLGKDCIAFNKYDGSNLRFEWSPKQGWHKFGTRKHLFDESDQIFGPAIKIFKEQMGDDILGSLIDSKFNRRRRIERITAFAEFFGSNSFAGVHQLNDRKDLKLFDIYLFKHGMISPKSFDEIFTGKDYAAEVMYRGPLNKKFISDVREGRYDVFEGVVAKGDDFMVKIKTNAYFKKLNEIYGTEYRLYWE